MKPTMRVLHIYAGNLYGGIETLLATLAQHQRLSPDVCHEFALCFEGRLSAELRSAGRPVHNLGAVRFRWPWTVWRARRRLRHLLRQERFDCVICHSCWPHALFAPVVKSKGCPLVFWAHTAVPRGHWLERRASRRSPDLIVANSRFTAEDVKQLFPGIPTSVLYCPVPAPAVGDAEVIRRQTRAMAGVPADAVVILQVSRMERGKGQTVLLDALNRLRDLPGWLCWIVGGAQRAEEERYQKQLTDAAAQAGLLGRVRFLGERTDVRHLLGAADVYCQPNIGADAFGITFVEALYAGLPVVTSALGGALEIVNADCGILVPPGDPAALAVVLHRLVADPAARARLGAAGPARARQLCDPQVVLMRLQEFLTGNVRQWQAS